MTRRSRIAAAVAVAAGCAWLPAQALAAAGDEAATLSYLRAERKLFDAVKAQLGPAQAAANRYAAQTAAECPGVAAQAPPGLALDELGAESLYAVSLAGERSYRAAIRAFASSVGRLRWSSRKLTALVHRYAQAQRAEAALATPPLCAELREWAAGGYGAVPRGSASFLKQVGVAEGSEEIFAGLAGYAHSHTKTMLRAVEQLEANAALAFLGAVVPAVKRLQEALGMHSASGAQPPSGAPGAPPA